MATILDHIADELDSLRSSPMTDQRATQTDVWIHVLRADIDARFTDARRRAAQWQPRPCPPRPEWSGRY